MPEDIPTEEVEKTTVPEEKELEKLKNELGYQKRQNEKLLKELEAIKKTEEEKKAAELSEVERIKKEKAELEAKLQEKEKEILKKELEIKKVEIFNELKVPHKFLKFVSGADEDELRANVQAFKESLAEVTTVGNIDAGVPPKRPEADKIRLTEEQKKEAEIYGLTEEDYARIILPHKKK
jgi:predicted RNase H-like nuclease (RuvC/YqgF family)